MTMTVDLSGRSDTLSLADLLKLDKALYDATGGGHKLRVLVTEAQQREVYSQLQNLPHIENPAAPSTRCNGIALELAQDPRFF